MTILAPLDLNDHQQETAHSQPELGMQIGENGVHKLL